MNNNNSLRMPFSFTYVDLILYYIVLLMSCIVINSGKYNFVPDIKMSSLQFNAFNLQQEKQK